MKMYKKEPNTNLKQETLQEMLQYNKTIQDVAYITVTKELKRNTEEYITYTLDKNQFFNVITNINYNNGYGTNEIELQLKIVFIDRSWMEREEYDGQEGWVYKKTPQLNNNIITDPELIQQLIMEGYIEEEDNNEQQEEEQSNIIKFHPKPFQLFNGHTPHVGLIAQSIPPPNDKKI